MFVLALDNFLAKLFFKDEEKVIIFVCVQLLWGFQKSSFKVGKSSDKLFSYALGWRLSPVTSKSRAHRLQSCIGGMGSPWIIPLQPRIWVEEGYQREQGKGEIHFQGQTLIFFYCLHPGGVGYGLARKYMQEITKCIKWTVHLLFRVF